MKYRFVICLVAVGILSTNVFAQDSANIIEKGDLRLGGKIGFGGVYGATVGVFVDGEYGVAENIFDISGNTSSLGVGAALGYSSYTQNIDFGFLGQGNPQTLAGHTKILSCCYLHIII